MAYNKITAEDTTGKGNVGMPDATRVIYIGNAEKT